MRTSGRTGAAVVICKPFYRRRTGGSDSRPGPGNPIGLAEAASLGWRQQHGDGTHDPFGASSELLAVDPAGGLAVQRERLADAHGHSRTTRQARTPPKEPVAPHDRHGKQRGSGTHG